MGKLGRLVIGFLRRAAAFYARHGIQADPSLAPLYAVGDIPLPGFAGDEAGHRAWVTISATRSNAMQRVAFRSASAALVSIAAWADRGGELALALASP